MDSIISEVSGGIAKITLNRPKVYNSFNKEMSALLHEHLDRCKEDKAIRAVYITGAGKGFCAGQDLAEATDPSGPEMRTIVRDHYNPIITRIRELNKPVVAAVNGIAAGAGANIALACDIVVATESASFIQAFSKIGLIPDSGGTFFLPRLIGFQKASALMMLADNISAKEAERLGMIYAWYADADFEHKTDALMQKLAGLPTRGLALTKQALNQSMTNDLSMQLKAEEDIQTVAGQTYDFKEGVAAFLEKRKPEFKGE